MYDLTVEEAHTFAVGDGQWVVHNSCPPHGISNFSGDVGNDTTFNSNSINEILPAEGSGWTGAYDMETGKFVAIPSDPMSTHLRATGAPPPGIVQRTGGHGTAADILRRELNIPFDENLADVMESRFIGFSLSYIEEGVLSMGWKSTNLNRGNNPYVTGLYVSSQYQRQIMQNIEAVLPDVITLVNP